MRRHILVSYDIADDKRRTKVFRALKDQGDHAQFSVFFCELTRAELATVRAMLTALIRHDEDQVLILDLGPHHNPLEGQVECIGKPYDPGPRCTIV